MSIDQPRGRFAYHEEVERLYYVFRNTQYKSKHASRVPKRLRRRANVLCFRITFATS